MLSEDAVAYPSNNLFEMRQFTYLVDSARTPSSSSPSNRPGRRSHSAVRRNPRSSRGPPQLGYRSELTNDRNEIGNCGGALP